MDRARRQAARLRGMSHQARQLTATVGGIALGALLIATGWAPAQLLGAVGVLGALLAARGGRFADAWLSDPVSETTSVWRRGRQATPAWAWQVTVGALVLIAAVVMAVELLSTGQFDSGTAGDLGKGAIALAMMASLLLWNGNGLAWLARRRDRR